MPALTCQLPGTNRKQEQSHDQQLTRLVCTLAAGAGKISTVHEAEDMISTL